MLQQLAETSAKIEIAINKLRMELPMVINRYTYHNKDPEEVLKGVNDELDEVEKFYREQIEERKSFTDFLTKCEDEEEDIWEAIKIIVSELNINRAAIEVDMDSIANGDETGRDSPEPMEIDNKENEIQPPNSKMVIPLRTPVRRVTKSTGMKPTPLRNLKP